MLINSLKLKNIRSYESQEIIFPKGSTLLAGDIGSGKSSILLAIEFALFGTRRKHLAASSLLRHGKKEGEVELKFTINKKEFIIKRKLKRGKDDIKQEAGYIIKDGLKKEGTHIELKTEILNLLGYPQDQVTKTRDLVYRYTVYTPQEHMKQIVLEDKDIRLDTLRKVFNIDKYKRIRENSQIFIKSLKEKRKNYEGQIIDLKQKKKQKQEKEDQITISNNNLKELLPKLELIKTKLNQNKTLIETKEKQINELNKLKKELELEELKLKNNLEKRKENAIEIERLTSEIEKIKKNLEEEEIKNLEEFLTLIKNKETQLNSSQKNLIGINKKLSEFETKKQHSNETKEKITKIDQCPVCLQKVTDEHKESINQREQNNISELEKHIQLHKNQEQINKQQIQDLQNEINELRKKQTEIKATLVKKQSLKEKESKKTILEQQQITTKQEIGNINIKKIELNKQIEPLKNIEEEYKKTKQEFDIIQKENHKLEINKREIEVKIEETKKLIQTLEEEINKKLKIKQSLTKLSQYQNWLDEHFINLMNTMEKHVMLQVYAEFNELFQQWFNILIEDESLNTRLDDEFSPIIEQNGYETSIENLSGGEKTAVALAYRLALNKVINDIVGEIRTKDLIILDEPTDGFSSEQLDKIRIVLEELNINQVIIVSHESKIESFVDNVIRINKAEHVSEVT